MKTCFRFLLVLVVLIANCVCNSEEIKVIFGGHHVGKITSVQYSPDAQSILTAGADSRTITWDVINVPGMKKQMWTNAPYWKESNVRLVAKYSPDGKSVISARALALTMVNPEGRTATYNIGSAALLDARSLTLKQDLSEYLQWSGSVRNPGMSVWAVFFGPPNHFTLFEYWGYASDWPLSGAPYLVKRELSPPSCPETRRFGEFEIPTDMSLDGKLIIALNGYPGRSDYANYALLIDANTGAGLWRLGADTDHHDKPVTDAKFTPNARFVVTVSEDCAVILWDLVTKLPHRFPIQWHGERINSVAVSPNGKYLITGSDDNKAIIWDIERFTTDWTTPPPTLRLSHQGKVSCVAYSPMGGTVLTSVENVAYLWGDIPGPTNRHELKCVASTGGSIIANPPAGSDGMYAEGTEVTLTAVASSAYHFERWADRTGTITKNPVLSVTVDDSKNLSAFFVSDSAAPEFYDFKMQGGRIKLGWSGGGALQWAPAPNGPWTTTDSNQGYHDEVASSIGARFFRVMR